MNYLLVATIKSPFKMNFEIWHFLTTEWPTPLKFKTWGNHSCIHLNLPMNLLCKIVTCYSLSAYISFFTHLNLNLNIMNQFNIQRNWKWPSNIIERSILSILRDLLELKAFFIIYVAVPWPTCGHRQRVSHTHPILINVRYLICCKGHQELGTGKWEPSYLESLSPNFETSGINILKMTKLSQCGPVASKEYLIKDQIFNLCHICHLIHVKIAYSLIFSYLWICIIWFPLVPKISKNVYRLKHW